MALFVYYWKTAKNERHEGEIEAENREVAFAKLRERGIRAIKVEPKGWESGKGYKGVKKRVVLGIAVGVAMITGGIAFFAGRVSDPTGILVDTTQGTVSISFASPLARQQIPGDRGRLNNLPTNLFAHASEFMLAKFAEPGRNVDFERLVFPSDEDFKAALKKRIRIASNEFTEYVDLKRIVCGMKRELSAYIAAGGTVDQYKIELVKRQKQEVAYRQKAQNNLNELITKRNNANLKPGPGYQERLAQHHQNCAKAAYEYWLKANAQLDSMGIWELPLPDELKSYQMSMGLD